MVCGFIFILLQQFFFSIFLKHMYQVCSLCRISNHNPFPPNPKSSETSSQFICQEQWWFCCKCTLSSSRMHFARNTHSTQNHGSLPSSWLRLANHFLSLFLVS